MRLVRRILVTVAIVFAVILASACWIAPVALSFYAAKKAPAIARVVPTDVKDQTTSQGPGMKLSYFGYEFEVPWNDLDEAKTTLYPKDKPEKTRVVLGFRSGLQLIVTAVPAREFANEFATDFKMPTQQFEAVFGQGTATSDYNFVRNVYEFTPAKMHYWSLSTGVHDREQAVLIVKSLMPAKAAETGIFYVQNKDYHGFQQGDPKHRQDSLVLDLYSEDNHFEVILLQKNYHHATGVTQSEINRVIQSLRRTTPTEAATLRN